MLKNYQWLPVAWELGGKSVTSVSLPRGRLCKEEVPSFCEREARGSPLLSLPQRPH